MPNIIQTARGVYDVDTVFGCYSYLIRECGLSGDRCAMVNKLYVMANIAELGAENTRPDERLVDDLLKAHADYIRAKDSCGLSGDIDQAEARLKMARAALGKGE